MAGTRALQWYDLFELNQKQKSEERSPDQAFFAGGFKNLGSVAVNAMEQQL